MDFAQLVLDRLSDLGLNVNQAEARYGFPQGYIRGVVREDAKRAVPSIEKAEVIARAIGIDLQLGARPIGPVATIALNGEDFTRIPLHDASFSAGPGIENSGNGIVSQLVFGTDWLRKVGVKPEAAIMARVSGDSMAPCIQSGDLVMIDTSRREVPVVKPTKTPASLPIFAFIQDNEARVKRLARWSSEKILVLYSDNKDVLPELVAESDAHVLNILGQVVWSGHVWR